MSTLSEFIDPETRTRGLVSQVAREVGRLIVNGDLAQKSTLRPDDLCDAFDVSRPVIREAFRVLQAKGLLTARPGLGTRIQPPEFWHWLDPDFVTWRATCRKDEQRRELLDLRRAIEPMAARRAAEASREKRKPFCEMVFPGDPEEFRRADEAFHRCIMECTGNQVLTHLYTLSSLASCSAGCESGVDSVAAHTQTARAVAEGQAELAASAMSDLLAELITE